ncbi:uncharacterized protein GIQ15_04868 [Arthroderma uncinatum]|uniref:uncharacterized protein n=1 Tax=Arthroderma uncinatum TaxID=74035 RepID=UPI00144A6DDD|nr:uncharacterized protein GIQ15_04868 [Arthroderma uncinatum]KAF3482109.1 hypothetical protein GIQ15_04868 [Arthroderma uncinatum]
MLSRWHRTLTFTLTQLTLARPPARCVRRRRILLPHPRPLLARPDSISCSSQLRRPPHSARPLPARTHETPTLLCSNSPTASEIAGLTSSFVRWGHSRRLCDPPLTLSCGNGTARRAQEKNFIPNLLALDDIGTLFLPQREDTGNASLQGGRSAGDALDHAVGHQTDKPFHLRQDTPNINNHPPSIFIRTATMLANNTSIDLRFQAGSMPTSLADAIDSDSRSSSLSDIDETLSHGQLDDLSPRPSKFASEIDSEAETERIEDSPNHIRDRDKASIVLSGVGGVFASPSKLAQSTTYDELNDDEEDEEDEAEDTEASPSKPGRSVKTNGNGNASGNAFVEKEVEFRTSKLLDSHSTSQETLNLIKKRKRMNSVHDLAAMARDDDDEEPARKRRGSIAIEPSADDESIYPNARQTPGEDEVEPDVEPEAEAEVDAEVDDEMDKSKLNRNETSKPPSPSPVSDETYLSPSTKRGKKGKRDKRRGKKGNNDTYEDSTPGTGSVVESNGIDAVDDQGVDDTLVDAGDDPEATVKMEELTKKTTALDLLSDLERHFATLRDRIYDERISNINKELAQLSSPTPTHPEFLRQSAIIQSHIAAKIHHEKALHAYKLQALCVKSRAERAQCNSSYYQTVREIRESALDAVSEHQYKVQHDRFGGIGINSPGAGIGSGTYTGLGGPGTGILADSTSDAVTEYTIPFPTRLSKQIAHQAAYNREVAVLAGFAKYVGFPAAPSLKASRGQEMEEDLEKMGIRVRR